MDRSHKSSEYSKLYSFAMSCWIICYELKHLSYKVNLTWLALAKLFALSPSKLQSSKSYALGREEPPLYLYIFLTYHTPKLNVEIKCQKFLEYELKAKIVCLSVWDVQYTVSLLYTLICVVDVTLALGYD